MEKRKVVKAFLILAQVLLFVVLLALLVPQLPIGMRVTENAAATFQKADGGMQAATIRAYEPAFYRFTVRDGVAKGARAVADKYLQDTLQTVSSQYLRENGADSEIVLTQLASAGDDFCYSISGAQNGAVWEVWVVTGKEPQVLVKNMSEEAAQ